MHEDVDRTPLVFGCKIEAELAVAELHVHGVACEQDRRGLAHEDQDRNLVDRALRSHVEKDKTAQDKRLSARGARVE